MSDTTLKLSGNMVSIPTLVALPNNPKDYQILSYLINNENQSIHHLFTTLVSRNAKIDLIQSAMRAYYETI